ncbi:hypothetical protein BLNAU_19203 [Blattamonas nauphoetae]|uniref:Right handed beta helix domain-containing protein n=1 Tax=Blattamonas nauphoetae TaxID=2049346 RepID=A0ABQ9X2I8_9EUKA|nr:hypothetical protein BLNAU_19203 [Blattamonas nauphoetae]
MSDSAQPQSVFACDTLLSSSSFLNTTHHLAQQDKVPTSPSSSQRVHSVSVEQSTNHVPGITSRDFNKGGSFFCTNSSFSRISLDQPEPNADGVFEGQNFTDTSQKNITTSTSLVISFSLCTFRHITGSFSQACLYISGSFTSVTLSATVFFSIKNTNALGRGAGLSFETVSNPIVKQCLFSNCSGQDRGGGIHAYHMDLLSVEECTFDKCSAASGGGICTYRKNSLKVSNSAFISCSATGKGGGVCFAQPISQAIFSSVAFRSCASPTASSLLSGYYTEDASLVTFLQSDADMGKISFAGTDFTTKITTITATATVTSCEGVDPLYPGSASIRMTLSVSHTGTVLAKYTRAENAVDRLLIFTFSGLTNGLASLSESDHGYSTTDTYTIKNAQTVGLILSGTPSFSLKSGVISRSVDEAHATLDNDGNTTTIVLTGQNLSPGSYDVTITDTTNKATGFTATLTAPNTLTGTHLIYPPTAADVIKFAEDYLVSNVVYQGASISSSGVTFKTPTEPRRLESFTDEVLNAKKTHLTVVVHGRKLSTAQLKLKLQSDDGIIEVTSTLKNGDSASLYVDLAVGDTQTSTQLKFGLEYRLLAAFLGEDQLLVNSQVTMTVPNPPIVTLISTPPTCAGATFEVSVVGTNLPSGTTFKATLNSSHTFLILFSSSGSGSGTIKAGLESEVQFDTEYLMTSLVDSAVGSDEIVLVRAPKFRTPVGPTISKVEASLSPSTIENISIVVTGSNMIATGFELVVCEAGTSNEITIPVTFSDSQTGTGEAVVFGSTELKYGTNYSVISVRNSAVIAALKGTISFLTPATPPRITSSQCVLGDEMKTKAKISIVGEGFPSGTAFSIGLIERSSGGDVSGTNLRLSSTFGGLIGSEVQTSHELWEEVYGSEGKMKYGAEYRITDLSISGYRCGVNAAVSFNVDPEPSRIIGIENQLDIPQNLTNIRLYGRWIEQGTYEVRLNNQVGPRINVTFSDSKTEERKSEPVKVTVFGNNAILTFDTLYQIFSVISVDSLVPVLIDQTSTSFSIESPPRVETASITVDIPSETITLTLTGVLFNVGHEIIVTVNGTASGNQVSQETIATSTNSLSVNFSISPSSPIVSGDVHIVHQVYDRQKDDYYLLHSGLKFTPPHLPGILTATAVLHPSNKGFLVTLRGSDLPIGHTFRVSLQGTSFSFTIDFQTAQAGTSQLIPADVSSLEYDTEYQISNIVHLTNPNFRLSFTGSFRTPNKPRLTMIHLAESGSTDTTTCWIAPSQCQTLEVAWSSFQQFDGLFDEIIFGVNEKAMIGDNILIKTIKVCLKTDLTITDLIFSLPSFHSWLLSNTPSSVISGTGSIAISSVSIVSQHSASIGIGFLSLTDGILSISSFSVIDVLIQSDIVMINMTGETSRLSLDLTKCMLRNTNTTNAPFLLFSTSHAESSVSMTDTLFLSSNRIQTQTVSDIYQDSFLSITVPQLTTSITECVFDRSGTRAASGTIINSLLSLSIFTPTGTTNTTQCIVSLTRLLLVDCCPLDPSIGAIGITLPSCLCQVRLEECWFEETRSTSPFQYSSLGVPVLTPKRKPSFLASSQASGLVIRRDILIPSIRRKGSTFSSCRLGIVTKSDFSLQ